MQNKRSTTPKYVRVLIPLFLLVAWFAVAGIGGPYFGKIGEVASNDQSTFLPASAESTKVAGEIEKFQDASSIPAIIAFSNNSKKLDQAAIATITKTTAPLKDLSGSTGEVSPPIVSEDGKAALVVAAMDSSADYKAFSKAIHEKLNQADLSVSYSITGPVGFLSDLGKAFSGIDGLLLAVALAVVFIILLIVYRSPILPLLVLVNSMFALCASILIVYYLAKFGIVTLNGQVQGILFILVIGAATDYALLFVARYKEELHKHVEPYKALLASWHRSVEPIVAAGGTVIAGLLCLLLSDLTSNKALCPVGAIGIAMAIISALTLLPSLLLMWGRKVFWPRIPQYREALANDTQQQGIWAAVATFVRTRTRAVWIGTAVLLIICSFGILQLKANGIPQSDFVLGASEARDGQEIIDTHFPGGSGTPAYVIVPEGKLDTALKTLEADQGVASVSAQANNSPSGTLPLGKSATNAFPFRNATVKTVDGEVLLETTLQDAADSNAALATIERLRTNLHNTDQDIRIGGTAAVQLDTRTSSEHDRAVVIPAVLVVITIILMFLLRSILAPIILLATTMVSFTATLGIAALVFNHVFGFPGADPSVVLYGFIFLVALGIDYNIFLMTRVREESLNHGTKKGTLIGLIATGGVITSAGIVLSATFAALAVIPILFLVQLAFIVSLGVLIDTIIVRSLLVPALSHDIGNKIWWPPKKFNSKDTER
jgi:RND superfamily putative drug exporter